MGEIRRTRLKRGEPGSGRARPLRGSREGNTVAPSSFWLFSSVGSGVNNGFRYCGHGRGNKRERRIPGRPWLRNTDADCGELTTTPGSHIL
jgi:hypothetical protein